MSSFEVERWVVERWEVKKDKEREKERDRGIQIIRSLFDRYRCPGSFDPSQVVIYFSGDPEYFTYMNGAVTIRYLGHGLLSEEFVRVRDQILLIPLN